jgi:uncharacterized protein
VFNFNTNKQTNNKFSRSILVLWFALHFFSFLFSQEQIKNFYNNGNLSSEGFIENGKPNGYWKNYYENGKLKNEGNRVNFLLEGVWKFYFPNGNLQREINYLKGKKNGNLFNYDSTGYKMSSEKYIDNYKQGITEIYYRSGKIHYLIPYVKDKIHGTAIEYSDSGKVVTLTNYLTGIVERAEKVNRRNEIGLKEGKWVEFYENGQISVEENYRTGVLDGYKKVFDEKGNTLIIEKYVAGKKISNPKELREAKVIKAVYSNGKTRFEGSFLDSLPHGIHYYYSQQGKVDSVLFYEDGYLIEKGGMDTTKQKTGVWFEFYLSGELKGRGNYWSGKKTREWNYYFPNGKLEQTGSYDNGGYQTGIWKWFYENGGVLRVENFNKGKREGNFSEYFESGNILQQGNFLNDLKEGEWMYQMGNYLERGKYLNGERDSIWNAWWISSKKLRHKGNWIQGSAEGRHEWFYENGKKFIQGNFIAGEMSDNWSFYDESGTLFLTILYENNEEIGFNGVKIRSEFEKAKETLEEFRKK